jgi:sec-independent protein translocase protein TatB
VVAGTLDRVPFLSPAKILVILVVALIVLGPDKLPKMAKQIGGLWGDFRRFRVKLESDVRGSFPDLPSTEKITQAVRSPLAFLDTLAETHAPENATTSGSGPGLEPPGVSGEPVQPFSAVNRPTGVVVSGEEMSDIPGVSIVDSGGVVHRLRAGGMTVPDDPGMN